MTSYLIISITAFLAAVLTFFSGFGLGTLLAPVMMLFFPAEVAIAMTGIVHLINNILKLFLTGKHANKSVVLTFGVPAIVASFVGAWILLQISEMPVFFSYQIWGRDMNVYPVKFIIAILLMIFALIEIIPFFKKLQFSQKWMPFGGILSGFFGGLSGTQGALRSAFLIRSGLSKAAFIGTTAFVSTMVDITRLGVYSGGMIRHIEISNIYILLAAVCSAAAGAVLGNQLLKKVTIDFVKNAVAILLLVIAFGLASGLL